MGHNILTMDPIIKWIGGASAALLLAFGGAAVAGQFLDSGNASKSAKAEKAPDIAIVMPADEAAMTDEIVEEGEALEGTEEAEKDAEPTEKDEAEKASGNPDDFVVKRILPIEGPLRYGDWHWDTEGVPAGPIVVTVDLEARVVSVFQGGYEIGATVAMLGTPEHPTPLGTFPIIRKQRHNVSEKYGNAPMPWSMFLTRDGVAIHGGSEVENGYASHGCIAVPDEFASRLFAIAKRGDKVIITDGETMQMGDSIL